MPPPGERDEICAKGVEIYPAWKKYEARARRRTPHRGVRPQPELRGLMVLRVPPTRSASSCRAAGNHGQPRHAPCALDSTASSKSTSLAGRQVRTSRSGAWNGHRARSVPCCRTYHASSSRSVPRSTSHRSARGCARHRSRRPCGSIRQGLLLGGQRCCRHRCGRIHTQLPRSP
jgi:hypothetical protein